MKKIYALGVGHNTPVFIDLAESCGFEVCGLYHYNSERTGKQDHGFNIIGSFNDLFSKNDLKGMNFLLTMGDNQIRATLSEKIMSMGGNVPTLIHPSAVISRFASISPIGVYIYAFTLVQANSTIGNNTVLLSHVNISHNSSIGNSCFIAGGAIIGAYTNVCDEVFIGQGAISISGKVKEIGHKAYVGARSLITKDIPPHAIVMGQPAKVISYNTQQS